MLGRPFLLGPRARKEFGAFYRRLLGGSWLTAIVGDLGAGKFDGAWLVMKFENLNPSNTYWSKNYNLYSKIDTEVPRYLEFEQWWGGHVVLNAEEMQFIVDNLFVGIRAGYGNLAFSDGTRLDLRNIGSPIVVFCSKGDNITPPEQALDWALDLYGSVDDIRAHGRRSSTRFTRRSGISASSSRAPWPRRNTTSSPATSTLSMFCRPVSTRPS